MNEKRIQTVEDNKKMKNPLKRCHDLRRQRTHREALPGATKDSVAPQKTSLTKVVQLKVLNANSCALGYFREHLQSKKYRQSLVFRK